VAKRPGLIGVAAGTNGAGKSAIIGELLAATGGEYFNPDILARQLVVAGMAPVEANAEAWRTGFAALRRSIARNENFSFETTLGGRSITEELHVAIERGRDVCIWYVGLESPELHIARVRARVKRGGHDIPVAKIRERYSKSLANLVSFIGKAAEVHVYDNSRETRDGSPSARLILRMYERRLVYPDRETLLASTPEWAKPLAAAALRVAARGARQTRKKKGPA
jgi:predicted ABC-type ATPase